MRNKPATEDPHAFTQAGVDPANAEGPCGRRKHNTSKAMILGKFSRAKELPHPSVSPRRTNACCSEDNATMHAQGDTLFWIAGQQLNVLVFFPSSPWVILDLPCCLLPQPKNRHIKVSEIRQNDVPASHNVMNVFYHARNNGAAHTLSRARKGRDATLITSPTSFIVIDVALSCMTSGSIEEFITISNAISATLIASCNHSHHCRHYVGQ